MPPRKKLTPKYMTRYERARILGVRAIQLSLGAPIMVSLPEGEIDPLVIALKELKVHLLMRFFIRFDSIIGTQNSDNHPSIHARWHI